MACLALATVFAIVNYFTQWPYLNMISIASVVGYIAFGLLSKPNYKRMAARRTLVIPFIISRLVIAAVIIVVIVYAFIGA